MDTNKIIAENAVIYLKKFLILNREFLSYGYDVKTGYKLSLTTLDEFIAMRKELNSKIEDFDRNRDNPEYTDAMYQDLFNERRNFNIIYKRTVVLSDEEIDELLGYVKLSIETLGFERSESCEWDMFIENCISRLYKHYLSNFGENNSEYINLDKWKFFLRWGSLVRESFFNAKVSYSTYYSSSTGKYTIARFRINDSNYIPIYKLTDEIAEKKLDIKSKERYYRLKFPEYEINNFLNTEYSEITEKHFDSELLLAKNMYACIITKKEGKEIVFCLETEKEGKIMLKNIITEEYYLPESSEDYKIEKISLINDYFKLNNCGALCRNLYSHEKFIDDWEYYSFPHNEYKIFMTYFNMSDKEKNSLERYIERIVVEWLIILFQYKDTNVSEENINIFKTYFTDYLRVKVLESIVLDEEFKVDLYSDNGLVKLLVVSGIDGFYGFDTSTCMKGFHASFKGNILPDKHEVSKVIRKIRKNSDN